MGKSGISERARTILRKLKEAASATTVRHLLSEARGDSDRHRITGAELGQVERLAAQRLRDFDA